MVLPQFRGHQVTVLVCAVSQLHTINICHHVIPRHVNVICHAINDNAIPCVIHGNTWTAAILDPEHCCHGRECISIIMAYALPVLDQVKPVTDREIIPFRPGLCPWQYVKDTVFSHCTKVIVDTHAFLVIAHFVRNPCRVNGHEILHRKIPRDVLFAAAEILYSPVPSIDIHATGCRAYGFRVPARDGIARICRDAGTKSRHRDDGKCQ